MTARFAKDQMSFVMPTSFSNATTAPATTSVTWGPLAHVATAVRWVLDMPRRHAVLSELSALSDHELSDIGLSRGDLSRVFDRDFAQERFAARDAR